MLLRFLVTITALLMPLLASTGCAALQRREPLQVTVAGFEPQPGQGMELRMLAKLRVQNPNSTPVEYDGVSVEMNLQGKSFGAGVSDAQGSVPRFGEAVIAVPITVSAFRMAGQAVEMMRRGVSGPVTYEMKGKLHGSAFNSASFQTRGEFQLPVGAQPAP
jgi:LEA14-like dessication related protein